MQTWSAHNCGAHTCAGGGSVHAARPAGGAGRAGGRAPDLGPDADAAGGGSSGEGLSDEAGSDSDRGDEDELGVVSNDEDELGSDGLSDLAGPSSEGGSDAGGAGAAADGDGLSDLAGPGSEAGSDAGGAGAAADGDGLSDLAHGGGTGSSDSGDSGEADLGDPSDGGGSGGSDGESSGDTGGDRQGGGEHGGTVRVPGRRANQEGGGGLPGRGAAAAPVGAYVPPAARAAGANPAQAGSCATSRPPKAPRFSALGMEGDAPSLTCRQAFQLVTHKRPCARALKAWVDATAWSLPPLSSLPLSTACEV